MLDAKGDVRLGTVLRTVRHLKLRQLTAWAVSRSKPFLWSVCPSILPRKLERTGRKLLPIDWDSPVLKRFAELRREKASLRESVASFVLQGQFPLANRKYSFDGAVDWHREDIRVGEPLAGFELHYQGYLEDLSLGWLQTKDQRYLNKWLELIRSWIDNNPPSGDHFFRFSWSPYVISERIRNCLSSGYWLRDKMDSDLCATIEENLARQTSFLSYNLEYDLQGNHLLQNLCGLAVVTCLFGGADAKQIRKRAIRKLVRIAEEQVLSDGMHEERSFFYHVKALCDLLEVIAITGSENLYRVGPDETECLKTIENVTGRMAGFLCSILSEIHALPLLNDGEQVPKALAEYLIAKSSERCPVQLPHRKERSAGSGYFTGSVGPWAAVFDAGPPGPKHQLGHAHADHLSFELWTEGRKLICDSGNSTYAPGERRRRYRGTAAHNTIRIDGQDSLEVWSSFRVGRRPERVSSEVLKEDSAHIVWYGQHDGYRFLHGCPIHRRWFCMRNELVYIFDRVDGKDSHSVESFLHLHPAVQVNLAPEDFVEDLRHLSSETLLPLAHLLDKPCCGSVLRWRRVNENKVAGTGLIAGLWPADLQANLTEVNGWYAPAFAREVKNVGFCLLASCRLPVELAWIITADTFIRE